MLSSLRYFAAFDALRADTHAARSAVRKLHAHRLKVRIEPTRRAIVRVRYVVAKLRSFAASVTSFCHLYYLYPDGGQRPPLNFYLG